MESTKLEKKWQSKPYKGMIAKSEIYNSDKGYVVVSWIADEKTGQKLGDFHTYTYSLPLEKIIAGLEKINDIK